MGGQRWLVQCTPHFLFLVAPKRENGPCTVQKRKSAFYGGRGARLELGGQVRISLPAAWCGREFCPWLNGPVSLFAAAPRRFRQSRAYRFLFQHPPHERQRKEKKVDSTPANPPPAPSRGQRHAYPKSSPQARPPSPVSKRLFLFWTVHGPFSLFLRIRKRENGGCIGPAIFMAEILPARKGEYKLPLRGKRSPPCLTPPNSSP